MRTIQKKIRFEYLTEIISGRKNFDVRKDDFDVDVGDVLVLSEYIEGFGFTGLKIQRIIIHITRTKDVYPDNDGFVIMGFNEKL